MRKPSKANTSPSPRISKPSAAAVKGFAGLFMSRLNRTAISTMEAIRSHPAGAPVRKLSQAKLLMVTVFHYLTHLPGGLQDHLLLFGVKMSASSLSQRRQASPWEVFVELMKLFLEPVAQPDKHPEGFYLGRRLVAVDGTEFSLVNTEDIQEKVAKRRSRRGKSAFAKLPCAVLVELMHHNPLAAEVGQKRESEWALSLRLVDQIPTNSLVLLDRLYGKGAFVAKLFHRRIDFLVRVGLQPKILEVKKCLRDGSRIVVVGVRDPKSRSQIVERVELREIIVKAQRGDGRPVTVRLWTSLLDEKSAPAEELARLYMKRWEQELFFRELKHQMKSRGLLQSQTLQTACQEVAAMLVGAAILAKERAKLQAGQPLNRTVSLLKTWAYLEPLWAVLSVCSDILTGNQKKQMVKKFMDLIGQMLTPKRRDRGCPRVIRQPVRRWARKLYQRETSGEIVIQVVSDLPS